MQALESMSVARAAESIRHCEMDSLRRAELLATLGIFGRLVDRKLNVLSIIRREEIHESTLAQEFVLEGERIAARKSVLRVLALRFGEEKAREFTEALERITDLNRFDELHKLTVQARRLSQFRKAMTPT